MHFTGTITLALASLLLAACATNEPGAAAPDSVGAEPMTYDGLALVPDTLMDRVWIRPGYTLSDYRKVILESARIQFRPATRTTADGLQSPVTQFPLSAAQRQEIGALVGEAFTRSLTRLTLEQVTEAGADVLRVRGTLLDLDVRPTGDARAPYRVDSLGQLTFVVELIDSQTDTVLLRAVDTRSARLPGQTYPSETATQRPPVRRVIERWADLLVDALNDLTTLDQLHGA
ncbi:MAG: DUF3313 family protein [Pseudomonadales bacterium]